MSLSHPLRAGDVIAGKYVLERVIGRGTSSLVFAARHRELNQTVAIKLLRTGLARRPENGFRFRQQARAAASIEGEHVCRVLDVCSLEGGIPYVVLEYLEGHDLASELAANGGRRTSDAAVECVVQACAGLAEALVGGVVHADLKPSKLYWSERPDGTRALKVLGLGKLAAEQSTIPNWLLSRGEPIEVRGEERYRAPEQLADPVAVDACSNVWTLGAILYELLTGQPPLLSAASESGLARRLDERELSLPEGLAAVVARALAPARALRFASVAELAQALAAFAPPSSQEPLERIAHLLPAFPEPAHSLPRLMRQRLLLAMAGMAALGLAVHGLTSSPERDQTRHLLPGVATILRESRSVALADASPSAGGSRERDAAVEAALPLTAADAMPATPQGAETPRPAAAIAVPPRPLRSRPEAPAAAHPAPAVRRLSDFGGRR